MALRFVVLLYCLMPAIAWSQEYLDADWQTIRAFSQHLQEHHLQKEQQSFCTVMLAANTLLSSQQDTLRFILAHSYFTQDNFTASGEQLHVLSRSNSAFYDKSTVLRDYSNFLANKPIPIGLFPTNTSALYEPHVKVMMANAIMSKQVFLYDSICSEIPTAKQWHEYHTIAEP